MTDFVIGMFIAAARFAARWPQPFRFMARDALRYVPLEHFEPEVAAAIRDWELAIEELVN